VNGGLNWTAQTLSPAWDIRDAMLSASFYSPFLSQHVLLHTGGHDDTVLNFRPNEVWGSSDLGVSWTLFPRAPFRGRNHGAMLVTPQNLLVVVAGKTDLPGSLYGYPTTNLGVNDI
jgi:hypothetical protein